MKKVGSFIYDPTDGSIAGPPDYMRERFPAFKAKVEAGECAAFNHGCVGRDTMTAFLVAVQTDYAGWKGLRSLGGGGLR